MSEINRSVFKKFNSCRIDYKKDASSYATKNLVDLKSALREAKSESVPTSFDFEKWPTKQAAT
ncbi:hypothetical protein [Maribacter litoralis]|uniref:hypothetical protein n=1 Tax=Maribacter litoralis TaxID=2059726 RepID=UPI003D2BC0E3